MSDWHDIDASCINCGKKLRAKWNHNHGQSFVLSGAYPVMVSHADGTNECVIIKRPTCYDVWTANRELKLAESRGRALEELNHE